MYCSMYDVPLSQQNVVSTTGVATVGDADMKLRKCVVGTKVQVECGMTTVNFRVFGGSPAHYRHFGGKFFSFFYPSTLSSGS